ncbi:hypothetical protein BXZ70DRAFT_910850 [Cristinia sonorae]|uniref:Uncharacterized protein n=1 Tax=Cristinia sonorae TaxID=1940300 RepID=A0A8K0UGZ1_9AGAR|nr:hypothetical protein BXZ70DRAFT_910850 [Cristinia sonorae]
MASRLGRRALAQLARPNLRFNAQNASRRSMSSSAHSTPKSDKPWIIASALVFGPAAVYLLSPPAKAKAHDAHHASLPKHNPTPHTPIPDTPLPVKDDEGTEVPAKEVEDSAKAAFNDDSPKDAQASEEGKSEQPEGESTPEEPKPEEPAVPEGADPETAETEQKEKPSAQTEESPNDLGEARERSKSGQAPKDAANDN